MPLYDYDCVACGRRIEVVHGVHAPGPAHCPNCGGGPLKKAIAAPAVHFKGSGWAKRDRRATVAPGTARNAGEAAATIEGDAAGGWAAESAPDGGKAAESAADRGAGGGPAEVADRPDTSAKTAGSATATRTD